MNEESTRYRRRPVLDELIENDSMVVMRGPSVVQLAGAGPVILCSMTNEWTTLDQLTRRVRELIGEPPADTAENLVEEALDALMAQDLVEIDPPGSQDPA